MSLIERKLHSYNVCLVVNDSIVEVEIHETEMGGWLLYECFILPEYHLIQLVFDYEELLVLDEEEDAEKQMLTDALLHLLQRKQVSQIVNSHY